MKTGYTHIVMVLDRSGSMQPIRDDTIGGVNEFISKQTSGTGTCTMTLLQFDDQFDFVFQDTPIHKVPLLTKETYVPRGSTALWDAMGRAIRSTGAHLSSLNEYERPDRVIFVTVTDGYENASLHTSKSALNSMISEQRDKYRWEFLFIGANQDAIVSAQELGIPKSHAINYAANPIGTQAAYAATSSNILRARAGGQSVTVEWTDEQREEQLRAKIKGK
jgi:hypothetical protein